jgi:hypothetical protein
MESLVYVYALYHDSVGQECFSEYLSEEDREVNKKYYDEPHGLGYKGLVKTAEGVNVAESNQLRLSSIPKGETPICIVTYNKDAYTQHCKDYLSYQEWLEKRNESRWVDVQSHVQKIDGKNMMHCKRLMQMAKEIGEGKGIIVRRPNAEELISIRRGEVDLQTLINSVEEEIKEVDRIFEESSLPEKIDESFINKLIIDIRKQIYKL